MPLLLPRIMVLPYCPAWQRKGRDRREHVHALWPPGVAVRRLLVHTPASRYCYLYCLVPLTIYGS